MEMQFWGGSYEAETTNYLNGENMERVFSGGCSTTPKYMVSKHDLYCLSYQSYKYL